MKTPLFTAGARSNLGSATLILDSDDCEIADCARSSHAAFIVRACNSHKALVKALEFIRDGYDNQDVNHVDFRVKAYQVALDALASAREAQP